MTLALLIVGILGWLVASLAFASLSLFQTITGLPGRIIDYFIERKERRERQRIARAREAYQRERVKTLLDQIRKGEL